VIILVAFVGIEYRSLLFATSIEQEEYEFNLCEFNRIKKFDTNGKLIANWDEKNGPMHL
jgi:hypothetical protein